MGALTDAELDLALAADVGDRRSGDRASLELAAERGAAAGARPRAPREVRHRDGPPRRARPRRRHPARSTGRRRRAASSWPGSGPTSPPPTSSTRGFFGEQLERFAAVVERARADHPGTPRPRRQQRGDAPRRRRRTSTWSAAASRSTGSTPSARTRADREPRAGAGAPLLRRRRQALRGRRERRIRAHVARRERDTCVGVLPIGYGDGVRRALSNNAEVLVGGRRYPLVGTVSMDNVTIDLGAGSRASSPVAEATLIGADGDDRILAEDLARRHRHDQLRDHVRDLVARPPRLRGARERDRLALGTRIRETPAARAVARRARVAPGRLDRRRRGPRRRARPRRRRRRRRGRRPPRTTPRGRSPGARAPPRSRSRRSSGPGASPRRTGWHVDVSRAAVGIDRGGPRGSATSRSTRWRCRWRRWRSATTRRSSTRSPASADVERGGVRATGEGAFEDDPLRLLRAPRIAAELGLAIDEATADLARRSAARARRRPPASGSSRSCACCSAGRDPLRGLDLLDELGGDRGRASRARRAARGRAEPEPPPRRPRAHPRRCSSGGSRWRTTSSRYVGDAAGEVRDAAGRAAGRRARPRSGAMRFAALFHDLGKPATRDASRGYITFIGHDRVGAEVVGRALRAAAHQPAPRRLPGEHHPSPPAPRVPRPPAAARRGAPSTSTCERPTPTRSTSRC